jgi:hypothetical protein
MVWYSWSEFVRAGVACLASEILRIGTPTILSALTGTVMLGIDLGTTLANLDYSVAQYEHAIDSLILAKKFEELHYALGSTTSMVLGLKSTLVKNFVNSLGKNLVALGFSYAAEGKGAFLFGLGTEIFEEDVDGVREASLEMYDRASQDECWLALLPHLSPSISSSSMMIPDVPSIKVRAGVYTNILTTYIRPIGGWFEDWNAQLGAAIRIYEYDGGQGAIVYDPFMEYFWTKYRDTGVTRLDLRATTQDVTRMESTDSNIDGIYGDSLCTYYDSLPDTVDVGLVVTHENGDVDSGFQSVDVASLLAMPDSDYCLVYVGCPVTALVMSSDGTSIGYLPDGSYVNSIPGGYRVGFGTSSAYYLPAHETYEIQITGLSSGSYELSAMSLSTEFQRHIRLSNVTASSGGTDVFNVDVESLLLEFDFASTQYCDIDIVNQNSSDASALSLYDAQFNESCSYQIEVVDVDSQTEADDLTATLRVDTDCDGDTDLVADLEDGMTGEDIEMALTESSTALPWTYILIPAAAVCVFALAALLLIRKRRTAGRD